MLAVMVSPITLGVENQLPAAPSGFGAGGYLVQLIGGLVFVVVAILAFGWMMRRFSATSGLGQPRAIEILAVRSLGTREKLMLIQVGDEQLLIGVSPAGLRTLHALQQPLQIPTPEKAGVDFASLLRKQMNKNSDA
jgi:flagellar protein FliO/FliZ